MEIYQVFENFLRLKIIIFLICNLKEKNMEKYIISMFFVESMVSTGIFLWNIKTY